MNIDNLKRAFRRQLPPHHPLEAGATVGSRPYEALPEVLPVVTIAMLLISAVIYYLTDIHTSGDYSEKALALNKLGHRDDLNILMRDWWGVLSGAFFHGGFIHIIMNSMALFTLGSLMEKGIGSLKTLLLYLAFALMSGSYQVLVSNIHLLDDNLFSLLPQFSGASPFGSSLGLSGIVFAIIGFMWGSWKRWTGFLTVFNFRLLRFVFIWQLICFAMTWFGPQPIANTAHISGLIFGFFTGMWMCYGTKDAKLWFSLSLCMFILGIGGVIYYSIHFRNILEEMIPDLIEKGYIINTPLFQ